VAKSAFFFFFFGFGAHVRKKTEKMVEMMEKWTKPAYCVFISVAQVVYFSITK